MQKWDNKDNEAMRGYILYAASLLNGDSRADYGDNRISGEDLGALLQYLHRATEDLTTEEARAYYMAAMNFN